MRTHLRVDSVKVFEDDAKKLERIQKAYNIKTKGDAYRKAVDFMDRFSELHTASLAAINALTEEVRDGNAKTNERLEDLYFKINTTNAQK